MISDLTNSDNTNSDSRMPPYVHASDINDKQVAFMMDTTTTTTQSTT